MQVSNGCFFLPGEPILEGPEKNEQPRILANCEDCGHAKLSWVLSKSPYTLYVAIPVPA